jgi:hypothetical protein
MRNSFKKYFLTAGLLVVMVGSFASVNLARATAEEETPPEPTDIRSSAMEQLQAGVESEPGANDAQYVDPRLVIAEVIKIALSLLATIFTILLVLSGYWFLISRGNEEKTKKAIDNARQAVTGLIIVFVAYALTSYIVNSLRGVVEKGNPAAYFEE